MCIRDSRTIDRLQSTLAGAGESDEPRTAAGSTLSAIKGLLASRTGEGDLENTTPADPGLLTLVTRVLQTLDQLELSIDDLTLTDVEARRLGEIAFLAGDRDWANACYVAAAEIAPGQLATLRSLCRLSRDSGDDDNSEEIVNPDTTNSKNDFTKTVEVNIPQYSEEGTWTLDSISATDAAGNDLYIARDSDGNYINRQTNESIDLDFKTEFEVINSNPVAGDITPPEFKDIELSQYIFDVTNEDKTFDLSLIDPFSIF